MKVLIGVDPHKASLAVTAIDEATSELLERASFLQDQAGLRSLERWAKRFPKRRWAVENAGGLGRHLAVRLAGSGDSVVDVPPKLSARVRVLSTGNARKNDELDALATALAASHNGRLAVVDPKAESEVLRLLSERREDLVAERTRALNRLHGLLRDLMPGGVTGMLSADRAACILRGIRPQSSSSRVRRRLASEVLRDVRRPDRKVADLNGRIESEVEASDTTLTEIFGIGPILAAKIIGTVGNVARFPTKAHFASYAGTAPVEASSGEVVRHRDFRWPATVSSTTLCTWWRYARPGRTLGAEPTTARSSRRASPARRRCGASRDASPMPFSRALWQIRRCSHAAPLDKEEPRTPSRRS
jgi:transposase